MLFVIWRLYELEKTLKINAHKYWFTLFPVIREQQPDVFFKKRVFKNFAIFTDTYVLESYFNKVGLQACNFIKKDSNTDASVWILLTFYLFFEEHLRMAASGNIFLFCIITNYNNVPVDTGRKFNVHKTFRRRLWRLLNILCTFN